MLLPNDVEVVLLDERMAPIREWAVENTAAGEWKAYIVGDPGKTFAIQLSTSSRTKDDLAADVWLNGGATKVHTVKFNAGVSKHRVFRGVEGEGMLHPFTFHKVPTTEYQAEACDDDHILGSLGEICISASPYSKQRRDNNRYGGYGRQRDRFTALAGTGLMIYEKNKTAAIQGMSIALGQGQSMGGNRRRNRPPPPFVFVRHEPVFKIRFLARSEYALKTAGIVDHFDDFEQDNKPRLLTGSSAPLRIEPAPASATVLANRVIRGLRKPRPLAAITMNAPAMPAVPSNHARASSPPFQILKIKREVSSSFEIIGVNRSVTSQDRYDDEIQFISPPPPSTARRALPFTGPGQSSQDPLYVPGDDEEEDQFDLFLPADSTQQHETQSREHSQVHV